jgi:hypothetical protein
VIGTADHFNLSPKNSFMKTNLGSADRLIRILLAAVLLTLYFTGIIQGITGIILAVLAIVLVLTSFIGICPLYLPFGLNTNRKKIATKS